MEKNCNHSYYIIKKTNDGEIIIVCDLCFKTARLGDENNVIFPSVFDNVKDKYD